MTAGTTITVRFHVVMPADSAALQASHHAALDRRDEITEALAPLGLRVSLIDCGLDVYLADEGMPTLGETVTALAEGSWQVERTETNG
jgi:hypothetical protein